MQWDNHVPTCVRSGACQPTDNIASSRREETRGQGRRDGEHAGETFNFSSKNFSCSLRRPECIARLATRRGRKLKFMRWRAFSRPRVSRDVRRRPAGRNARYEGHHRKDVAARVPARKKVERLRKFATKCEEFTQICKSDLFPLVARARVLFRVNYRIIKLPLPHARLPYAWLRRDLNYVIWIISLMSFKRGAMYFSSLFE